MNVKLDVMTIKKGMVEKRLTGAKLAALSGLSRNSISTILTRGTCAVVNAGVIADALGMEIEDIVREG